MESKNLFTKNLIQLSVFEDIYLDFIKKNLLIYNILLNIKKIYKYLMAECENQLVGFWIKSKNNFFVYDQCFIYYWLLLKQGLFSLHLLIFPCFANI